QISHSVITAFAYMTGRDIRPPLSTHSTPRYRTSSCMPVSKLKLFDHNNTHHTDRYMFSSSSGARVSSRCVGRRYFFYIASFLVSLENTDVEFVLKQRGKR
ncbi:unnamed protein product, partial [Sphacelaria rigidula]